MDSPPNPPAILSIPQYLHPLPPPPPPSRSSTDHDPDSSDTETMEAGPDRQTDNEDGIGEYDDGKTGKLTLSILLAEGLIEPGEGVMSIDYLGQSFKGDLLAVGKIRSVETGLVFNNPSVSSSFDHKYRQSCGSVESGSIISSGSGYGSGSNPYPGF
jgi:hypothetical protein